PVAAGDFRPEAAPTDWVLFVESQIERLPPWAMYHDFELHRVRERLLRDHEAWPDGRRQLGEVVVRAATMVYRLELGKTDGAPIAPSYWVKSAASEIRELAQGLGYLAESAVTQVASEREAADWVRWLHHRILDNPQMLTSASASAVTWMWLGWLYAYPDLLRAERAYLDGRIAQCEQRPSAENEPLLHLRRLRTVLDLLTGESDVRAETLVSLYGDDFEATNQCLSALSHSRRWDLYQALLATVSERLEPGNVWAQALAAPWLRLAHEVPEAEPLCRAFLRRHLPVTTGEYRTFLLQREEFVDWADYVMGSGGLDGVSKEERRLVEQQAPEVLIPILHQEVHRLVELRGRDHYRQACRRLKQLRKCYRKLKQTEEWEAYLRRFTHRHRRLRALLEEMNKAKVMPQ
ncbi:MAG: hypothetical protein K6T63_05825, partial [Alicyclobacillus herbarius]|nr:hypothetical protein [Alicyclobacillus herbarius]